jgi:hypothetical protein
LPLARNFYSKSTYVKKGNEAPKLVMHAFHGGTPTAMTENKEHGQAQSKIAMDQIKSFSQELHINSLTSSRGLVSIFVPIEKNEDSHITNAINGDNNVSHSITPVASYVRRLAASDTIKYEEILETIGKKIERSGMGDEIFALAYLKDGNKQSSYQKSLDMLTQDEKKYLQLCVETKKLLLEKNHWTLNDKDNVFAKISANMQLIIQKTKAIQADDTKYPLLNAKLKDVELPNVFVHCKSGKDRTGADLTISSALAVADELGLETNSDEYKSNITNQINAGHSATMAASQGGSHGAFGIKRVNMPGDVIPLERQQIIQNKAAGLNAFKFGKVKINKDKVSSQSCIDTNIGANKTANKDSVQQNSASLWSPAKFVKKEKDGTSTWVHEHKTDKSLNIIEKGNATNGYNFTIPKVDPSGITLSIPNRNGIEKLRLRFDANGVLEHPPGTPSLEDMLTQQFLKNTKVEQKWLREKILEANPYLAKTRDVSVSVNGHMHAHLRSVINR